MHWALTVAECLNWRKRAGSQLTGGNGVSISVNAVRSFSENSSECSNFELKITFVKTDGQLTISHKNVKTLTKTTRLD